MPRQFAIRDAQLRALYANIEKDFRADPDVVIDDWVVNDLLAVVGRRRGKAPDALYEEMTSGALSPAEIVELAKTGLNKTERKDLERILDAGEVPLTERANNLLEAVVGRARLSSSAFAEATDGLEIDASQKHGIRGWAMPGATIEAINLSTTPGGRLFLTDTVAIGKADANGNFKGKYVGQLRGSRQGDIVRVRARTDDGQTTNWLTVRLDGLGRKDTRNAVVNLARVHLQVTGRGKIGVSNVSSRPISEPGGRLRLVNERTRQQATITLDGNGTFPPDTTVKGKPGDVFTVAASDGANNESFTDKCGELFCGGGERNQGVLPDPLLHSDELGKNGKPRFAIRNFHGPVFVKGVKCTDVAQGYLANCFFPAAMAAIADTHPRAIKDMVRDNGDGTYTVTFKKWVARRYAYEDVEITVDGDLWVRSNGAPLYGTSSNTPRTPDQMEMWYPIIEKAHAVWKNGSYQEMGSGGQCGDVFEACLGQWPDYKDTRGTTEKEMWKFLTGACDKGQPVTATTYGESKEALYTNTGIYSDHAYSILGYSTSRSGKREVRIRNPWGESEPKGNGHDDGIFKLPLPDFMRLYESAHTCAPFA